jgi:hypothetical protein
MTTRTRRSTGWALAGALALAGAGPAAQGQVAAPPELVTDRPDQTESPATVPPGYVQVEAGWLGSRDGRGDARVEREEGPGTLVRLGLVDGVELRLGWEGRVEEKVGRGGRDRTAGAGDAELGVKVRLGRPPAGAPGPTEAALLFGVTLPVGARRLTSDRYDPAFRLAVAHALSDRLDLAANLGMSWSSEPGEAGVRETFSSVDYTVALGRALGGRLGAFVEAFGSLPADAPGGAAHSLDGGLTFQLRPNLQFDLAAGAGLTAEAPDRFLGVGVAVRWPR